ncbi:MAG: DNA repair protein RecO [Dehalococcoidia bacterium]|nr:DNA repair protein RecO [Dehalococcoidia bacterium]
MSKPHTFQTPAVIIKKTRLGEADVIFTLYTPHLGKIQGIAKSVRKTASRLAGHLELLTYSQVTLARGKNLDTIIGSQTINSFLPLKSNLELISCGLYLLELINQFTPDETSDPGLFDLVLTSLEHLARGADCQMLLRHFEMRLLRHAGYHPELAHCVACQKPLEERGAALFALSAGGLICINCNQAKGHRGYGLSPNALHLMRLLQAGEWQDIDQIVVDDTPLREVQRLMQSYIRSILERDIRSAAWLVTIEQSSIYAQR